MRLLVPAAAVAAFGVLMSSSGHGQTPRERAQAAKAATPAGPPLPSVRPAAARSQSAALVARGDAARTAQAFEQAIDFYESALAVDPASDRAYLGLARVAQEQRLFGRALRFYREGLQVAPGSVDLLAGQGQALAARGAAARAQVVRGRVVALCPTGCAQLSELDAAIARGTVAPPMPRVATPAKVN